MEIGNRLGPIVIQREIGRGGMGSVYLGFHESLNIPVAIKVLLPSLSDAQLLDRFALEARALAQVNHPNVVRVLDFVRDHTPPYIVQEYIDGKTLRQYLIERDKLDPQEAVRIIMEVALALKAAHKLGIVHRDVKPENIFLTSEGGIKLCDFGLATPFDGSIDEHNWVAGTPYYMAPEQMLGDVPPDGRIDIYALGIVLYELLLGKKPFESHEFNGFHELLNLKLTNEVQIPDSILPTLVPILYAMTRNNRDERIQSVDELIDALRLVYDPMLGLDIHDYRLARTIGRGGQGKVYLAFGPTGPAAMKILLSDEGIKPEARTRFRLEGKVSKYLDHPNVVKVHEYGEAVLTIHGETKRLHFIIMDFIKGVDLEGWVMSQKKPDHNEAARIVSDVLAGLDYAHKKGLIHRDVKARNVLITEDGAVKLADFGLCKYNAEYNPQTSFSFSALTDSDTILGSPHFMSPEQIKASKEVDKRTDIYSCGVLLFYLCTHELPFTGTTAVTIMLSILSEPTPDPRKLNRKIPEELAKVIIKMLEKDPSQRFQSCQEVREQINSYLNEVGAAPLDLSEKYSKQSIVQPNISTPTVFALVGNQKGGETVQLQSVEVSDVDIPTFEDTIAIDPKSD